MNANSTGGGNGPLTTILNQNAGGKRSTPGTNVNSAIKNNPVSKAIKDTIDHVKGALGGSPATGGTSAGAGTGGGTTG